MKDKTWYTLEKHHNLWTIWKHHESNHSVGIWGIYTDLLKKNCLDYAKDNNIKLKRVWK